MTDYKELSGFLDGLCDNREEKCSVCPYEEDFPCCVDCIDTALHKASKAIQELCADLRTCRNELCLRCGKYREAHKGACDGCRWKECPW